MMDTDHKFKTRRRRLLLPPCQQNPNQLNNNNYNCHFYHQTEQKDIALPYYKNPNDPYPNVKITKDESTHGKNCNKRTKHSSLLASMSLLEDHKRTNNNRIGSNVFTLSLLVIYTFFLFFTFFTFATATHPNSNNDNIVISSNNNHNHNHNEDETFLIPVGVSYAKAYNTRTVSSSISSTSKSSSGRSRIKRKNQKSKNHNDNATNSTSQIPTTSNSRPFYTKITSNDAVAKPSSYNVNNFKVTTGTTTTTTTTTSTTKKPPKIKQQPKRSFEMKPSKLYTSSSYSDMDSPHTFDTAMLMTSSTEKSFINTGGSKDKRNSTSSLSLSSFLTTNTDSGPKIRLEPFFNLLTSFQSLALGTSKEQKFSPSYQTITQSIDENTKKSKAKGKGSKGLRDKKEKRRNRNKNKKYNHKEDGPIPIPIPRPVIHPDDDDDDGNYKNDGVLRKPTLHPLDILNVPMDSNSTGGGGSGGGDGYQKTYESITLPNRGPYENITQTTEANSRSSSITANTNIDPNTSGSEGPESKERRLRSDFFENFHDKDVDLQADESNTDPDFSPPSEPSNPDGGSKIRPNSGRNVNIPQGYTHPSDIEVAPSSDTDSNFKPTNGNGGRSPPFSTIFPTGQAKTEDINMISKYPMSFSYNPNGPLPPPPPGTYIQPHYPIPIPYPKSKLRPNLHSYYDQNYHNYAGYGETNESPSVHHGPPYPNHHQPPSGYGNSYNNNNGNSYGSHYIGHTLPFSTSGSSNLANPIKNNNKPSGHNYYPPSSPSTPTGTAALGATSDLAQQGSNSDSTFDPDSDNSVNNNQKIGVMNSFDIFYKEYKVLAWAAFFVVTSLALLSLLTYLYVNNPPTEVVTARNSFFNIDKLMSNPQIVNFLSNLMDANRNGTGTGRQQRKKFKKALAQQPLYSKGSLGAQLLSKAIKKDL